MRHAALLLPAANMGSKMRSACSNLLLRADSRLARSLSCRERACQGAKIEGLSMLYNAFKVIHLLGITVFLGNIIVTGIWKALADRTKEPGVVAYAQRLVTLTDWIFTAGGVVLILIGAYGMAFTAGLDLRQTWLLWGQGLFIASGVIWVLILIPTQIVQAKQAHSFAAGGAIPESYWRHSRRWYVWGALATLIPLANLNVMVFKP
jgi:uncharacterized membrane protein